MAPNPLNRAQRQATAKGGGWVERCCELARRLPALGSRGPRLLAALAALGSAALGSPGCAQDSSDAAPERVVEALIERMRSVHGDPERGRRALEFMSRESLANLTERAQRATAAAGRAVPPEEMLVPSRFALRFEPHRFSSEIRGDFSRVTVLGDLPNEVAEIHCIRENGQWRVVLDWPSLPIIEKRQ